MTIWIPEIDKETKGPLYRNLADSIERDIYAGTLRPGHRLPTHRELADELGMNVSTVTRGYREAESRGLISGTVGRGTFVASDAVTSTPMVSSEPYSPGMIEMGLINPLVFMDPDLNQGLKRLARRRDPGVFMNYSDPRGLPEHRAVGALWAARYGFDARAEDVIVCSGAQHALTCCLSGLFRSGDWIATDHLIYPGMKTLAALLGVRLVPIEMDSEGMVAESLDMACRRNDIKGLYLVPGVQNPTTTTMSGARRDEIAGVAAKHGLIIIEDDAYDLTGPAMQLPVTVRNPENSVFIAGVSKAMAPGLRVAFMIVPKKFRRPLSEAVLSTIWMTPPLNVELVSMWIKDGTADRVVAAKRAEAEKRFRIAGTILEDYPFAGLPTGFFIWLTLSEPWTGATFEAKAREVGINLFSAEKFTVGGAVAPPAVRLSLCHTEALADLKKGLTLIREILANTHLDSVPIV
ncbi:MAG: PLP-dependent aminotransferase family protein [Desulfobacteraceae bacterium]|nr:PLP-dependent aminotransferase family protein [Desulfobacteraceae bacterium]